MIVILVTDPSGQEQVLPGDGLLQWEQGAGTYVAPVLTDGSRV
jgi:hypothetical protein